VGVPHSRPELRVCAARPHSAPMETDETAYTEVRV